MMNRQGRATKAAQTSGSAAQEPTISGNYGLDIEEPLLFEVGRADVTGVDVEGSVDEGSAHKFGNMARAGSIGLPGLSEPEVMRHYTRLARKNYAIDSGIYPLGSCTMKHNPRLNEKMARLPGFSNIHPLQPQSTVQGALELMSELSHWLLTMTGMTGVALSPKAGAHGELCGMIAIKAALAARGEQREIVLVPESAHGTNPATAALLGYKVQTIAARDDGTVSIEAVEEAVSGSDGKNIAAIMLTNPNTCGVFERDIIKIADAVHKVGAYFYCDGANFNAIVGMVRPGDLGIDAMHINLHKTFSTPHGGGGPGSGPVVFSEALTPFAPYPYLMQDGDALRLIENETDKDGAGESSAQPFGRLTAYHGQMGMFVRAMSYMMSHGSDGLRQASQDAVLNANYVRAKLKDVMSLAFEDTLAMHEVLFDDRFLKDTGVTTLDFAKAMLDEGLHPMTVYFPLVVHGAMLIEPTESESKESLDQFIEIMLGLVKAAKAGKVEEFQNAPIYTPLRRLDETKAARQPVLRWQEEPLGGAAKAAE